MKLFHSKEEELKYWEDDVAYWKQKYEEAISKVRDYEQCLTIAKDRLKSLQEEG